MIILATYKSNLKSCVIYIPDERIYSYFESLIKKFYKILPIYEGRHHKTKEIIYTPEEAFKNYQKYMQNLIFEMSGSHEMFPKNELLGELLSMAFGMQLININEHGELRPQVFKCVSKCEQLLKDLTGK